MSAQNMQPPSKVGGQPRTMAVGMGLMATGFLAFYLAQFRLHAKDDQSWILSHGSQPGGIAIAYTPHLVKDNVPADRSAVSSTLPLPSGATEGRRADLLSSLLALHLGRGFHPDPSVPEHAGTIPVPSPQRMNADGSKYTKKHEPYAEGYRSRA